MVDCGLGGWCVTSLSRPTYSCAAASAATVARKAKWFERVSEESWQSFASVDWHLRTTCYVLDGHHASPCYVTHK